MAEITISKFGENARATIALEMLRLCVAIMDALGFEARVYANEDGKRLADMHSLPEFNLTDAFIQGQELKKLVLNLMESLGDEQANKSKSFDFKNKKENQDGK